MACHLSSIQWCAPCYRHGLGRESGFVWFVESSFHYLPRTSPEDFHWSLTSTDLASLTHQGVYVVSYCYFIGHLENHPSNPSLFLSILGYPARHQSHTAPHHDTPSKHLRIQIRAIFSLYQSTSQRRSRQTCEANNTEDHAHANARLL